MAEAGVEATSTVAVADLSTGFEPGATIGEGRYRVLKRLGEGGMGSVYAAKDLRLDRTVAIKVLHEQDAAARALLRQEASLLATLHDPRVIAITDLGESGAALFMVTEYLQGQTLQQFLDGYFVPRSSDGAVLAARPIPVGLTLRIGSTIAGALRAVHSVGYIHRDLKPANLMLEVSKDGVEWLKLIDFGLSTRSGIAATRAGTPIYLAPETAEEGKGGLGGVTGPGTDLYSLGCLLYEMLTGAPMFDGTTLEILEAHQRPSRPRANTGFDELDDFLATLLARRLEDRPSSAKEVASELARLDAKLSERSTHVGPAPFAPQTRKLPPREPTTAAPTQQVLVELNRSNQSRTRLFAALSLALVVLAWGLWFLMSRVEPGPEVVPVVTAPSPSVEVVVDAGAAVAEVDPLEVLPKLPLTPVEKIKPVTVKPTVVVLAPQACTFDDRFRDYARRTRADLRTMGKTDAPEFVRVDDRLAEALIERDCRGANAALDAMRRLVGAPIE